MRALTVAPGVPNSARVDEVPEPPAADGSVLVRSLALGICATDREIVAGDYGAPPPGQQRLILGHESLGCVEEAPADCGLDAGDLVVGIVRRPDPVPCAACAVGEWDMCRNGEYTERGIKARNGYGAERFRIEPQFTVKLDPILGIHGVLLEPASIMAKAWEHTDYVGRRSKAWQPRTLLVTGAGPIGLLAALMGAQRGLDVHVLDRDTGGEKESLARELGGTYHCGDLDTATHLRPDILMECTGAPALIAGVLGRTAPAGIACLVGIAAPGHQCKLDIGSIDRTLVGDNDLVLGSINANRRHFEAAAEALRRAKPSWLGRLITRRVPLEHWREALHQKKGDIKVAIDFTL
ncbi:MAG TPA: glucose 1-dehydrogenase [Xanthobacteraceae bacterium]|nr:glucose 1-dehydrogenase [Xanthobacteraceae bacterium]